LCASEGLAGLEFVGCDCDCIGLDVDFSRGLGLELRLGFMYGCRWGVTDANAVLVLFLVDSLDFHLLSLGYHLVVEGPASAASELGYNDVAVSQELDVKVDVVDGLAMLGLG
jgi:hypothetical protein